MSDTSRKILVLESGYSNDGTDISKLVKVFGACVLKNPVDVTKKDLSAADVVVFTGGVDVHPSMYGELPHETVNWTNQARDAAEKDIFTWCATAKTPMVGICRGGQIGTVLNGGKLIQHIGGHTGGHGNRHGAKLCNSNISIQVSSDHHQIMVPPEDTSKYTLLAVDAIHELPEVIWYPDTRFLAIQYHPEWHDQYEQGRSYFYFLFRKYVLAEKGYEHCVYSPGGHYLPFNALPASNAHNGSTSAHPGSRVALSKRAVSVAPPNPDAVEEVV